MLGRDVCQTVQTDGHTLAAFARTDLDITNGDETEAIIARENPDAIIHCAAWTNVNGAEENPQAAFAVNADGAKNVAVACAQIGAIMVYVSTDYVFDGAKGAPYTETDPINPLGVYGQSKADGEAHVRHLLPDRHVIARTSWLYGGPPETKNFVRTIQRLARTLPSVPVVCDQVGCPTATLPLSELLVALAEDLVPGTYHTACAGQASWFEFAQEIVRLSGLTTPVVPITTEEYTARFGPQAPRPAHSPLTCDALTQREWELPEWKSALAAFLAMDKRKRKAVE